MIRDNSLVPRCSGNSGRNLTDPTLKDNVLIGTHIDFSVARRARYVHSVWKRHQDAVFWVDIDLAIKKGLTFYRTRSNAIILQKTLPAYCIPKVERWKTGKVLYEKTYHFVLLLHPTGSFSCPPPRLPTKNVEGQE